MDLPRSSDCVASEATTSDTAAVAKISTITDEVESCGYRRVGAELRHRRHTVDGTKVRRLMKEHDLNPRRRWWFTRTADSDHGGPTSRFVARDLEIHGPDRLRIADIAYVAKATGFVHAGLVPHALSRRVVGSAIARRTEAGDLLAPALAGMLGPLGAQRAIRLGEASRALGRARLRWLHEPEGQPLRKPAGRGALSIP